MKTKNSLGIDIYYPLAQLKIMMCLTYFSSQKIFLITTIQGYANFKC